MRGRKRTRQELRFDEEKEIKDVFPHGKEIDCPRCGYVTFSDYGKVFFGEIYMGFTCHHCSAEFYGNYERIPPNGYFNTKIVETVRFYDERFYSLSVNSLGQAKNNRLWFLNSCSEDDPCHEVAPRKRVNSIFN